MLRVALALPSQLLPVSERPAGVTEPGPVVNVGITDVERTSAVHHDHDRGKETARSGRGGPPPLVSQ